jgi:hypothetical protein
VEILFHKVNSGLFVARKLFALRKGYYYSPRLKMVTKSFRKNKIMQPMRRLSMDGKGPTFLFRVEGGLKEGFFAQEVMLFCLDRFA